MNFVLSDVVLLAMLIIAGALWWHGQGIKAFALRRVRQYCQEHDLQLLDESLVLKRLWLARGADGLLKVRRRYGFEFTSTGEFRYRGAVVILGYQVDAMDLDSHHLV
ncbi:DUF3301 domain-containing protein [Reinekea thalattae]|nr:DUF3301 domain-containing protein [Reinekea thalattae]